MYRQLRIRAPESGAVTCSRTLQESCGPVECSGRSRMIGAGAAGANRRQLTAREDAAQRSSPAAAGLRIVDPTSRKDAIDRLG